MTAPRETTRQAPGKINLYLRVTGRRDDGYHELDSLVAFTELHDLVVLRPAADLRLSIDGPFAEALGHARDNLVMKAAKRLQGVTGGDCGARITLTKNLPVAAGLGGGSADAAATLLGLCRLWNIDRSQVDIAAIGADLGADVPVCLYGRPAVVAGAGEQVTAAPELPRVGLLLVNPGRALPTANVFRARRGPFSERLLFAGVGAGVADLAVALAERGNDLVAAAVSQCAEIEKILAVLGGLPSCRGTGMSGSGATCFGLFDDPQAAVHAAFLMPQNDWWVASTSLRSATAPDVSVTPGNASSEAGTLRGE